MHSVSLRCLDGLIVFWGVMACLLISGGQELLAAPGDCDKECRMPSTFATYDGTKNSCFQFEMPDCKYCTGGGGGCNSNVQKSMNPNCAEDTTMKKRVSNKNFECTIYCNTVTKDIPYEATTSVNEFKYIDTELFVHKCVPKAGGLP